jgi:hypothetical protein
MNVALAKTSVNLSPVMQSSSAQRTTAFLALVAMLMLQICGGVTRYYCDCHGEAVITLTDHCPGAHAATDHEPNDHRHDHSAEPESPHHHELITPPTDALTPAVVTAPVGTTSIAWTVSIPTVKATSPELEVPVTGPPRNPRPPSQALIVKRSIEFLI